MKDENLICEKPVHFRTITEKFCAHIGDNVVVMHTVNESSEFFECMNAKSCPNASKCKNNI